MKKIDASNSVFLNLLGVKSKLKTNFEVTILVKIFVSLCHGKYFYGLQKHQIDAYIA